MLPLLLLQRGRMCLGGWGEEGSMGAGGCSWPEVMCVRAAWERGERGGESPGSATSVGKEDSARRCCGRHSMLLERGRLEQVV